MRYLLLFFLGLTLSACVTDELPTLKPNVLHPDQPGPFVILDTKVVATSQTRATVTVSFSSVYERLNAVQKAKIDGIEIVSGGTIGRFMLPADATSFELPNLRRGQRHCMEMHFLSDEGEVERLDFCLTP